MTIMQTVTCPAPLLWSPRETAHALGVSPRKLWAMTQAGEIPSLRLGRLVKFRPEAVAQFLAGLERHGEGAK